MNLRLPEGFFGSRPIPRIGTVFELQSVDLHKLYFSSQKGESYPMSQEFERHGIVIDAVLVPLGIPDESGAVCRPFIVVWEWPPNGRCRVYGRTTSFAFDLKVGPLLGDVPAEPRDLVPVLADEFFHALFQSGCCELVPSPTRLDVLQFV